jgi:hypothetical protein
MIRRTSTRQNVKSTSSVAVLLAIGLTLISLTHTPRAQSGTAYMIVDTGQDECYSDSAEITPPLPGQPYHGQDAQVDGHQPVYALGGDGLTVHDSITGLTWQQSPDTDGNGQIDSDDKLTWIEFQSYPDSLNAQNFGGYDDWRRPTIRELYSLIDFSGIDPSGYTGGSSGLVPFIDTQYFAFAYGDESAGERIIDAQYWSSTQYVGLVFGGDPAVFGVNFADGRIKGYPRDTGPGGTMTQFVRCVRGNTDYGVNSFVDHGDGTVTDGATGLMWQQADDGSAYNWEDALSYAEGLVFAGYDDWRLPNAKELQSIVDYTRSPSTTGSPAIDEVFSCTSIIDEAGNTDYPFYWTGTTHANWTDRPGYFAAYVAFGEALGYFGPPGLEQWVDVHGAGAQRSDPKRGDPADWPTGNGPQGDAIRIYNYVRCVRDVPSANQAPGQPATPEGPTSGEVDGSYEYSTRVSDPEGDDVAYWFDWGDGQSSGWTAYVPSGTTSSAAHSWASAGTYMVTVKAKDLHGAESDWSTGRSVSIGSDCPITQSGDVNADGSITAADIVYLVGYALKSGPVPQPCEAAGDVNCSGAVTASDVIGLVVHVFKSGSPPCDVCTLIPDTWTCS